MRISRSTRKQTLWTLRNVSTNRNDFWNRKSTRCKTCLSGWACASWLVWSWSILYAETTLLVFSWDGSYMCLLPVFYSFYVFDSLLLNYLFVMFSTIYYHSCVPGFVLMESYWNEVNYNCLYLYTSTHMKWNWEPLNKDMLKRKQGKSSIFTCTLQFIET